jgi:hypothetical protein
MRGRIATRALVPSAIAGGIALVIYVIISATTAKNANATSIVVGGVLLGLFTLVVAFIITVIISSIVGRRAQR